MKDQKPPGDNTCHGHGNYTAPDCIINFIGTRLPVMIKAYDVDGLMLQHLRALYWHRYCKIWANAIIAYTASYTDPRTTKNNYKFYLKFTRQTSLQTLQYHHLRDELQMNLSWLLQE